MSRILEFQPADEQTVVARVLLELHHAIDAHFPDAKGSSRQFTKTVLSSRSENTAVDQKPGTPQASADTKPASRQSDTSHFGSQVIANRQEHGSSLEFSRVDKTFAGLTATALEEASWSRRLTKLLIAGLFIGSVLLAWIYLFGAPRF